MSKKSIGILIIMLAILFLLYSTVGVGITMFIMAVILLAQAIIFNLKPQYYDRFLKFMNPVLYSTYIEKGEEFIKKKRRINIVSYYIVSVLFIFNSFIQMKTSSRSEIQPVFNYKEYLIIAVIIIPVTILISYLSKLIMKKSKTAGEDLVWNIVLGVAIAAIMIIAMGLYFVHMILGTIS